MTDLEGITNQMLENGYEKDEIIKTLNQLYKIFKSKLEIHEIEKMSNLIFDEILKTKTKPKNQLVKKLLTVDKVNLSVGKQGVGCRGLGDFVAHELVTKMASGVKNAFMPPECMDDAGAVIINTNQTKNNNDENKGKKIFVVTKMEGMHSRLSDFPFIAGFHVTRACLRDLLVKGAKPISIMVDIHLGDDADISKLFDFMAGVSCISELTNVPITAGSTLRIGGDMVIGTRITGGIAGVGIAENILARKNIKSDADILMTEGAGGGTIATTAIYNGQPDKIIHTLNIKFLNAMNLIINSKDIMKSIYCCTDVTNGGLRGDLFEILKDSNAGVEIFEKQVIELVNENVLKLLNDTNTDYLGVSLDALLIFCKKNASSKIKNLLEKHDIKCNKIGQCTKNKKIIIHDLDGNPKEFKPMFRESAYTPIKKLVGVNTDKNQQENMKMLVKKAFDNAISKKNNIINWIKKQYQ
ncbi:MAG: AIR synthase-related protein [Promethearchaeota archaeon]